MNPESAVADFLINNPRELTHPVDRNFKFRWLYFWVFEEKNIKIKIGHSCNPVSRNKVQKAPTQSFFYPLGFMEQREAYRKEQEVFSQIREFVVRVPVLKYSDTPTNCVDFNFKHSYAFSGATETFIVPNFIDFKKILHILKEVSDQSMQETGGKSEDLFNLIASLNSIPTEKIKNIYDI
jgi:hypothetical protein